MKRDFSAQILDLDDQPVRVGATVESLSQAIAAMLPKLSAEQVKEFDAALSAAAGKALTLASACSSALLAAHQDESNLGDDERIARMELARKIHKGGVIDITATERDRIKPLLKKRFGGILIPVVAGELLETAPVLDPVPETP